MCGGREALISQREVSPMRGVFQLVRQWEGMECVPERVLAEEHQSVSVKIWFARAICVCVCFMMERAKQRKDAGRNTKNACERVSAEIGLSKRHRDCIKVHEGRNNSEYTATAKNTLNWSEHMHTHVHVCALLKMVLSSVATRQGSAM
jgi:hypothetical protein